MSSFRIQNLKLKTVSMVCSVGIALGVVKLDAKTLELEAFPSPANFILRHKQTGQMVETSLHEFLLFACKEELKYWNFTADNCAVAKKVREYKQKISRLVDSENKLIAITNQGAEMLKAWDLRQLIAHQFLELFDNENSEVEVLDLVVEVFMLRHNIIKQYAEIFEKIKTKSIRPHTAQLILNEGFLNSFYLTHSPFGASLSMFKSIQCGLDDQACMSLKDLWGAFNAGIIDAHREQLQEIKGIFDLIEQEDLGDREEYSKLRKIKKLALYLNQHSGVDLNFDEVKQGLLNIDDQFTGLSDNQKIWNAAIVTIAVSEALNLLSHDIQIDFYKSQMRTQDLSRLVKQVKTICTKNLETIKSAINNLSNEIEIGEAI